MPTLTVTAARAKFSALIEQIAISHEPLLIIGKRNNAVLISEEDWRVINRLINQKQAFQDVKVSADTPQEVSEHKPPSS